jgi:hypothetical protein
MAPMRAIQGVDHRAYRDPLESKGGRLVGSAVFAREAGLSTAEANGGS